MSDTINRARALIESRLAELDAESRKLKAALESMGEGTTSRPGRQRNLSATKARRKTTRRAPRGRRREELLAAIKADPGARPSDLARTIGISSNQVHALIAKARAEKLLVRKGKGYALRK